MTSTNALKSLIASSLLITAPSVYALSLDQLQGESRQEFHSPYGARELCVVAKKWPGAVYKNDDTKKETTLCSYDFHRTMGVCPKYSSTNPALMILEPSEKFSKEAIDASDCNLDRMDVKTEAKFKQTITCSYTPSILSYYHMSRILGGVGRVPVAVVRTMDIKAHALQTQKANRYLQNSSSAIATSWRQYQKVHTTPRAYPELVDSSLGQIYGVLSDNVKKEEKYTEVSGTGTYETRYSRFLRQKPFQKVASSQSVTQLTGSSDFSKVAQNVIQMKDVADMVLIDTLLNQQDRIGNIHYKFFWYSINPASNRIERMKSDAKISSGKIVVPTEESKLMVGRKAALVKEMVLKDNDCGVTKDNMMRKHSALEKVRHFSYLTYRYFMAFEKSLTKPATKDYFLKEMLYTESDFRTLVANTAKAKEILKGRCRAGQLRFDLDLEEYIPGARITSKPCDI